MFPKLRLTLTALPLVLAGSAHAVSDNVTLTFPPSAKDTCLTADSPASITVSTAFLPPAGLGGCLTLKDIFTGNGTTRDTSYGFANSTGDLERLFIHFTLSGTYDPEANYSRVLYTQDLPWIVPTEPIEQGNDVYFAKRNVQYYQGSDCTNGDPGDEEVIPFYGSDCRATKDCEQVPFNVRSFFVRTPDEDEDGKDNRKREKKNECVLAAYAGGAGVMKPGLGMVLVVAAVVGGTFAVM